MIELLTKSQIIELINEGKLLPSEIEKMRYENIKEYCIENHIIRREDIYQDYDDEVCVLCEVYKDCKYCPLTQTGNCCNDYNSPWDRYFCSYGDEDFYEFMSRLDAIIWSLDKATEYEKVITKILKPESIRKLCECGCSEDTLDDIIDDLVNLFNCDRINDWD